MRAHRSAIIACAQHRCPLHTHIPRYPLHNLAHDQNDDECNLHLFMACARRACSLYDPCPLKRRFSASAERACATRVLIISDIHRRCGWRNWWRCGVLERRRQCAGARMCHHKLSHQIRVRARAAPGQLTEIRKVYVSHTQTHKHMRQCSALHTQERAAL